MQLKKLKGKTIVKATAVVSDGNTVEFALFFSDGSNAALVATAPPPKASVALYADDRDEHPQSLRCA